MEARADTVTAHVEAPAVPQPPHQSSRHLLNPGVAPKRYCFLLSVPITRYPGGTPKVPRPEVHLGACWRVTTLL